MDIKGADNMYYIAAMQQDYNGELYNPCGSDHGLFIRDLKTIKGVLNRIKKMHFRKNTIQVNVYQINSSSIYGPRTLVAKVYDFNKMTF